MPDFKLQRMQLERQWIKLLKWQFKKILNINIKFPFLDIIRQVFLEFEDVKWNISLGCYALENKSTSSRSVGSPAVLQIR